MPFGLILEMITSLLASEGIMMGGRAVGKHLLGGAAEKAAASLASNAVGRAATGALGRVAASAPWAGKILPATAQEGLSGAISGIGGLANLGVGLAGGNLVSDYLFSKGHGPSTPSPDRLSEMATKDRLNQQASLQSALQQYLSGMGGTV